MNGENFEEGVATLRRLVNSKEIESLYFWMVEFENEPGAEYMRRVNREDKVK